MSASSCMGMSTIYLFFKKPFHFQEVIFFQVTDTEEKKVFRLSYQAGGNLIIFMHLLDLLLVGGLNMLPGK